MNFKFPLFIISLSTSLTFIALGQHPPGGPGPGFGGPEFAGPTVTGAPFSAVKTTTHQQTLADGNQIQQTLSEKLYRDNDGRSRTEMTLTTPGGDTKTVITISDPVAGFVAHLNPAKSTAVKLTLPAGHAGDHTPPTPPADANIVKSDLGTQTIAGLSATGVSITRTIPVNAFGNAQPIVETREIWTSTALKIPVKMTSVDPERGNSSMILSNVLQAAPDATLFQIPFGYTVTDAPAGPHPGMHGPEFGPGPGGPPPASL